MPEAFRRSLATVQPNRRAAVLCGMPRRTPLSARALALILFERDPGVMATQVRAWLAESDDA